MTISSNFIGEADGVVGGGATVHQLISQLNNDNNHNFIHRLRSDNYIDNDNDTDINNDIYTGLNIDSIFYDMDSFIKKFSNSKSPLFMNLNVQSLNSKHEKLKNFVLALSNKGIVIDIIAMQETWSIKYPELLTIPGYQQLIFLNRKKGKGGGIGFYVRNGLNYKIVDHSTP